MAEITITGYSRDGHCEHCGRALKHVVHTTEGLVGATCFDKVLTAPRQYHGTPYRIGAHHVIRLAKAAQFWAPFRQARDGLHPTHFVFEKAQ